MSQKFSTKANRRLRRSERQGTILVLVALLTVPLIGIVAFAVDYGHLMKVRCDLQRYADCAALAAVQDLLPDATGYQDLPAVRAATREYITKNLGAGFTVLDADIEIGRYDPVTIYSQVSFLNSGIYDTVRVRLRRDSSANSEVPLFFAKAFGLNSADVVASGTAVLQKARYLYPGADILPLAVPEGDWESTSVGDQWTIYGDEKMEDSSGNTVPGNWGTLDIGDTNNSTSDLGDQILNGLKQADLDALYADGRIPTSEYIDSQSETWMEADTGISTGMKSYVRQVHGKTRIIPLYEATSGTSGNNLQFKITSWGVVKVIDSNWNGAHNTYVQVQKAYIYDGELRPHPSFSGYDDLVTGAYTSPALVE